ncbi:hypothetical protein MSAN_01398600 [Mycena sanguinolenta]|uniref:DUF6534 domain-containing protein n=1 Tax=Mycena sanguinolenta TaxID=230812 RepID=A0A8H6Y907_9AGAR|nr:hypothetical protein MSAN_01398600 [Mycena sanguinolenta]
MIEGLDSISLTLGAFIAGGMVAVGLSAIVGFQTFLYFQIFPLDTLPYKLLVAWIWLTDTGHTIAICITVWQYAILNFNNPAILLEITSGFPVNIMLTLIATLNANIFYAWRIHKMSKYNWWLTVPIVCFCFPSARYKEIQFDSVLVVSSKNRTGFIKLQTQLLKCKLIIKNWAALAARAQGAIVRGMAVSVATDIFISAARYYYLRDLKQGYMATQEMVDAVVIFTINDGILTCAMFIATIACFLAMPQNFVWAGLYFTVSKLFSNSILATLNLRNWYRHRHRPMGIRLTRPSANRSTFQITSGTSKMQSGSDMAELPARVEVFMDQQIEYNAPAAEKYNNVNDNCDAQLQS